MKAKDRRQKVRAVPGNWEKLINYLNSRWESREELFDLIDICWTCPHLGDRIFKLVAIRGDAFGLDILP